MNPLVLHDPVLGLVSHRVVLTGGPCAGKTEIMKRLQAAYGHRAGFMTEVASMLLNNGYPKPDSTNPEGFTDWLNYINRVILPTQVNMENGHLHAASQQSQDVVFFDRGLLDLAAYVGGQPALSARYGVDIPEAMRRYTIVIHLQTVAALGDEPYLALKATNPARHESPEEARQRDAELVLAWRGYPNWHLVTADGGIDAVYARVLSLISPLIDVEVERKWWVDWNALSPKLDLPLDLLPFVDIRQDYLLSANEAAEMRIRRMGENYFLAVKAGRGKKRAEWEPPMPAAIYQALRETGINDGYIEKRRHYVPDGKHPLELDFYSKPAGGLVVVEREFTSEREADVYSLPELWLPHVEEVTGNPLYKNQHMARLDRIT